MLLKYTSKKKLSCFFILCILRSCHSISMAYITSEFITIATHPVEVSKLYLFLVVVSLLILFFGCLGFAFSHMYNCSGKLAINVPCLDVVAVANGVEVVALDLLIRQPVLLQFCVVTGIVAV